MMEIPGLVGCPRCPFHTTDERKLKVHIQEKHGEPRVAARLARRGSRCPRCGHKVRVGNEIQFSPPLGWTHLFSCGSCDADPEGVC